MKRPIIGWLLAALFLLTACGGKEALTPDPSPAPTPAPTPEVKEHKVAMIFPIEEWDNVKQAVNWALEGAGTKLQLEWIDEKGGDFHQRVNAVTHDASYAAIIGPEYSSNARLVAQQSLSYRIPVILPTVTASNFQRIYSESNKDNPNIFCLAQNDIAQLEAVINMAVHDGFKKFCMISRDGKTDDYSSTFVENLFYLAPQSRLEDFGFLPYDSETSLKEMVDYGVKETESLGEYAFFFVPSSTEDMLAFDRIMAGYKGVSRIWPVYCSDIANEPTLGAKLTAGPYKGYSLGASDAFEKSWTKRFSTSLPGGYAQIYDAVQLVAQAAGRVDSGKEKTVREALQAILAAGFSGASGQLRITGATPIAPEETSYQGWSFLDGRYSVQGRITYHAEQGWKQTPLEPQIYDETPDHAGDYGPLENRRALVVSTSTGWKNYRHQADALAMYQMLKGFGYSDDDITLILEDDIANHPSNPHPGEVRVTPDGEDLRKGAVIDHKLSALSPNDLPGIFASLGGPGTDVLVFWCGHGVKDYELKWGESTLDGTKMWEIFNAAQGHYRKMFFVMDTCFSGSIAEYCIGVPGVLFFCSAAAGESSQADIYDDKWGTYLSNGFTRAFRKAVEDNPSIVLNNLYLQVARGTTGSHAGMYNNYSYGNLYRETTEEYFGKRK